MRKVVAAALVSLFIAGCGGQSIAPAPTAGPAAADTQVLPAPAPEPATPAVSAIVNVPEIAGKSQKDVAAILGEPTSCETVTQGKKCFYKPGETEIVFISGKADWITVEALDSAPYSEEALPLLGIDKVTATLSNENTVRWETIPGVLEVSIFPGQTGVDYAYIKAATP
ncbi:MAG TPA: hypothetical protein VEY50_04820 [Lysobacter sp.]|nr:hypothetical protein [Lysobacter sp.]